MRPSRSMHQHCLPFPLVGLVPEVGHDAGANPPALDLFHTNLDCYVVAYLNVDLRLRAYGYSRRILSYPYPGTASVSTLTPETDCKPQRLLFKQACFTRELWYTSLATV